MYKHIYNILMHIMLFLWLFCEIFSILYNSVSDQKAILVTAGIQVYQERA